ncbi:MAG: hypothetical protein R2865_12535 [Deinococcales bacterium]
MIALTACTPRQAEIEVILHPPLALDYELRRNQQPFGEDLVMVGNSIIITNLSIYPAKAFDVLGLSLDAGVFGGKKQLRVSLYLDGTLSEDSFAMHRYNALILQIDGTRYILHRDDDSIGLSKQGEELIEYGFFEVATHIFKGLAEARE